MEEDHRIREKVNYTLKDIPIATWRKLRRLALDRDMSTKAVLMEIIEREVASA